MKLKLLTCVSLLTLGGCATTHPPNDVAIATLFDPGVYYEIAKACSNGSPEACYQIAVARKALEFCLDNYRSSMDRANCTADLYNSAMANPTTLL